MAYSREEKQTAMTVLATLAGNAGMAAKELQEKHHFKVAPATIRRWRTSEMREFYDELLEAQGDLTQVIINEVMETARLAAQAERIAIERALADLNAGECKDPAKAARDLSHIKAMNVEKFLTLSGRPTQIVEVSNPDEAFLELAKLGVLQEVPKDQIVEGDAWEVDLALELEDGSVEGPAPEPSQ